MVRDDSQDARLARGFSALLDEIQLLNKGMREQEYALKQLARRRGHLLASADGMLRSLDLESKRQLMPRYAALAAEPTGRTRQRSRALRAVLEYLIDNEHDHVRAAELTWYVRRAGCRVSNGYGSNTLGRFPIRLDQQSDRKIATFQRVTCLEFRPD